MSRLGRPPILCAIVDRHGLADAGAAARAGVRLMQVRDRHLPASDLLALTRAVIAAVRGTDALVLVNDRADVALAAGAAGVHLPASGAPVGAVRRLGPEGWVVGRSVHDETEIDAAAGADYLIFGTVFASTSKPGHVPQGVGALGRACRRAPMPVLAIGGISAANAGDCARAGAAGVAGITIFRSDPAGGTPIEDIITTVDGAFRTV